MRRRFQKPGADRLPFIPAFRSLRPDQRRIVNRGCVDRAPCRPRICSATRKADNGNPQSSRRLVNLRSSVENPSVIGLSPETCKNTHQTE